MAGSDTRMQWEARAFLIALQFLTLWPVTLSSRPHPDEEGRAVLYYPLVGILIGILLVVIAALAGAVFAPPVVAALLLIAWAMATGALHLDGLADSADGWLGGRGERARTLRIMQDAHSGAAGVVAVVVVLLLKFTALTVLLASNHWWLLLFVPALARAAIVALLLTTPYARPGGMAATVGPRMPRDEATWTIAIVVSIIAVVAAAASGVVPAVLLLALPALALWGWRVAVMRRLGGTTGDTAGAAIEVSESLAILALTAAL